MHEIHVDGWILAFNLGVWLVTSLLFGLAPALQLSRTRESRNVGYAAARGSPAPAFVQQIIPGM